MEKLKNYGIKEFILKFLEILYGIIKGQTFEKDVIKKFLDELPKDVRENVRNFLETLQRLLLNFKLSSELSSSLIEIFQDELKIRDEKMKELMKEVHVMKQEVETMRKMQVELFNKKPSDSPESHELSMEEVKKMIENFMLNKIVFQRYLIDEIEKLLDSMMVEVEMKFKNGDITLLELKSHITKRAFLDISLKINSRKNKKSVVLHHYSFNSGAYIEKKGLKFKIGKDKDNS